jgi:endonuclease I
MNLKRFKVCRQTLVDFVAVMNLRAALIVSALCIPLSLSLGDAYDPPPGYYAASAGLNGTALDAALNAIVRGQTVRTYDQLRQDLAVTDRDWDFPPPSGSPTAATKIFLMYSVGWSGYSRSGVWDSGATWNREHTWPDSRGVGQPDTGPDFSDLHHLRAANPSANTARSNNYFDAGGTLAPVTSAPQARRTTTTWEPPDTDKGWIARALCYMATRYDGTETNTTDLVLVETPPDSTTGNPPQMGRKSTLLLWNRVHSPSEWERRRNQIIYDTFQHNRNPFIDHPEFADAIYEQPLGRETRLTWRYRNFTLDELGVDSMSGDGADPDGDGMNNLLEFGLAGDPKKSDPSILPSLALSPVAGNLRLTYRRQRDRALAMVSYVIETTDDLAGTWQTNTTGVEAAVVTVGNVETVSLDIPTTGNSFFARVRVTR